VEELLELVIDVAAEIAFDPVAGLLVPAALGILVAMVQAFFSAVRTVHEPRKLSLLGRNCVDTEVARRRHLWGLMHTAFRDALGGAILGLIMGVLVDWASQGDEGFKANIVLSRMSAILFGARGATLEVERWLRG
jgi:hypothetical protein